MIRLKTRVAAIAAACLLNHVAIAADHAQPDAAALVAAPVFQDPSLSPDGSHIAARAMIGGTGKIAIYDASAPDRVTQSFALPDGETLQWLRWAGNGRVLISVDKGHDTTRLAVIDLATGRQTPVELPRMGGEGDHVLHVDPAGTFILLSAQESERAMPGVWRIDLTSGVAAQVVKPQKGVTDWYADSAGVVRAGVGEKGEARFLVYRAAEGERFRRASRGPGDVEDSGADELVPVAGSDQGYAIAGTKEGRYALFRYDFASDRLGAKVYENPSVDVDSFETSPGGKLLGVTYTDDRERYTWFDAGMQTAQAKIDAALPGAVNRIIHPGGANERMLIASSSATDPGSYHLYDPATGKVTALAATHPELAANTLSPMESINYKARDGLSIQAYLTLPAGREAKDLPLIVMPHGGPFVRDSYGYDAWVQYLAGKGYAVLQPNYRGSTGFGRDFVEKGDGEWGRGMQDDVDDGVKWLAKQGIANGKRVCIMGASYGGYAAMLAAEDRKSVYRCAISYAGISDVARQLDYDHKTFESEMAFKSWRGRIQGAAPSLDALSPLKAVDRMTMPILIAHGTADETVPFEQSRLLHEALEARGRAHDYVVYPGEGHGLTDPKNNADFLGRVGAFLDRYNPS